MDITNPEKLKLAVWKFASCDGCQLSLLDCEDELLSLSELLSFANFAEASSRVVAGPYDLSLVEGSITTAHDAVRIREVRSQSKFLVTIGACATAGGIQALRNYTEVTDYVNYVYARPEYIRTLATSTPISRHVKVDFELQGCPINKSQLVEVISAFLLGRRPNVAPYSECIDCKLKGNVCVMVAHGTPCLGPITHAGCGALCPSYNRGCYGCYGPKETPNSGSLGRWFVKEMHQERSFVVRSLRSFYAGTELMEAASAEFEGEPSKENQEEAGEAAHGHAHT
ncbi:MAG: oxidoreductase [Bdellovibrionales bacterium GWC1_52_8]|nr:MAG: oxidoreductase [Bdellovibrionales bacterium GWB1_52_6]OFZ04149.1 MAG: oxidoreductase [Bdellovibrionales bacterium GWA1_52_35]OFZ33295.1 MAG: oxidoreductase [Bdellovibrionales bacterium GWC1_52_8]HCM40490.1 oxidoreductase [Bdellovibrionales bacterium]